MGFVITESRYWWKPALLPLTTSPLSEMLKGLHRLSISGSRFD
jgi:hypothetical protein